MKKFFAILVGSVMALQGYAFACGLDGDHLDKHSDVKAESSEKADAEL